MLDTQSNLAISYLQLVRLEQAVNAFRGVYSGFLKLKGEEHYDTLLAAQNYAESINGLQRFEEAKSLLRKTMPVARRVLGEGNEHTLKMRWIYARALYSDPDATLDDVRESVETLEDAERIARRVLGGAHPITKEMGNDLGTTRAVLLRACETLSPPGSA